MEKRTFFVALGVPRGAEADDSIHVAYQSVVTRYRRVLEADHAQQPVQALEEPPHAFAVMRSYSERRHASLFKQPETIEPPKNSEVDRFFDGFVPEVMLPPRARVEGKDLYVELRLGPDDAARGGLYPVHIPVVKTCPACGDMDEEQRLSCQSCHGSLQVTEDRMVEVTVPPGVENGSNARVAMEDVGLGHTDLLIHVLVG